MVTENLVLIIMASVVSVKLSQCAKWLRVMMIACISTGAWANSSDEITCYVEGTDDLFKVYPEQLVFKGQQFAIYQLIDGLTVLTVNTETMRFNRLSNLNLLANSTLDPSWPPEPTQYFSGKCE